VLDRRHLEAVIAIAEELHFGRAAARLKLQQSALSQLIRRLEKRLGFLLFDRSSHHVRLTPEGERMLVVAREVLAALRRAEDVASEIAAGESGTLRLGTTDAVDEELHVILERFHDRHSSVNVRLVAMHTDAKLRALLAGDLDVALVRAARSVEGIDMLELWREHLIVMLSRRHPLAARHELTIAELAPYPVILAPREWNEWARQRAQRLFASAGVEPVFGPPYTTLKETLATVSGSQSWTMVAGSVAARQCSAVVVSRPLQDPEAVGDMSLAWRSVDPPPVARAVVEVVKTLKGEGALGGVRRC
jgi:DNA-binding transcriptional LysR family regulator